MQPTVAGDELLSGALGEVVGVGQDDLRAGLREVGRGQCPDRSLRANGHEHRGLNGPTRGVQDACTGRPTGGVNVKWKGLHGAPLSRNPPPDVAWDGPAA